MNKMIAVSVQPTTLQTDIVSSNGQWTIIMVDKDGNDIEGSEFNMSGATFNKSYANNPLFRVKLKEPTIIYGKTYNRAIKRTGNTAGCSGCGNS